MSDGENFDSACRIVPRYDGPRFDIDTSKDIDGSIRYTLTHHGQPIGQLTPVEVVNLGERLFSVLRHLLPSTRL